MKATIPVTEKERLLDLYSYNILDTEAEKEYNEIVELASQIADTPVSLISFVDINRQWFKAKVGFPINETSRELSFCAHALTLANPLIVEDATKDERFVDNDLVLDETSIRFYAGFPLLSSQGNALGTLCVIDSQPKKLSIFQFKSLQKLSNQVIKLLELRQKNNELQQLRAQEHKQRLALEQLLDNQRKIMAILAHDTRGPLFSMKQLLQMLLNGLVKEADAPKVLKMMQDQTDVTLDMIDSLVGWGKIHLDAVDSLGNSTLQLNAIVDQVFAQYATAAKAKNLQFSKAITDNVRTNLNKETFSFIIRNLVNNAVKYTEKGEVKVTGSAKQKYYQLEVSDTGIGMTDKTRLNLFKGKQSSLKGTQNEQGSGLGLLLINDFIEQAGGKITVQSQLNSGTTIKIKIPVR